MQLTRTLASTAVATLLLVSPAVADTTFGAGSLIIPASATYQTDCGAVAMYGLVYDVLRANAWLQANGHGKIEIYYGYKETKASPNRCTPTNLHVGPSYTGSGTITHSHAKWNDGCDFEITNNAATPVKKVTNTTATNAATDTNVATIDTSAKTEVYPRWTSKTITHTTSTSTDVNIVRYSGGPFIIADTDAVTFLKLIQGTLVAKDSANNNIDFSPFRSTATCNFGTTSGGNVAIHRASIGFTAPTPRILQNAPPRLALLAKNTGTSTTKTGRVDDQILQDYLKNAGLNFTGAQGCPEDGAHAANATICPSGDMPGQIYDVFDFTDLKAGKLVSPTYKMLWAPHWEFQKTAADTTGPATLHEADVINSISDFLDGQNGLMAECASIETFEGQQDSSSNVTQAVSVGQFQTCVKNAAGECSASTTSYGIKKNSGSGDTANPRGVLYNCSEPTTVVSTGSECAYFGYSGDPFVQVADYRWNTDNGLVSRVADFQHNTSTSSIYRPGVLPLISGVSSLDKSKLSSPTAARAMINGDFATRNLKDNDLAKSNILYLAGHDLTGTVAGTKVVLQTLLQLGEGPVDTRMDEVSRAAPIAYTVNSTASIVQGTFERLTPGGTTITMTSAADAAAFRFPDVQGHMRAVSLTQYTTTAKKFEELTPLFDAANGIPSAANSYSGSCTQFSSTCRTVFTNTVGGFNPARVLFRSTNLGTIGPLMAPSLSATEHAILMKRVLAGFELTTDVFTSKLGGVDRSTVAVIPSSTVAGTARPTIIYFGATDGMMHAVCGSVLGACTTLGQELWAFMPRNQLSSVRLNTTRVDGSPRVTDLYGDFSNSGVRQFRTILSFHTASGDPTTAGKTPAVYALDVTDPTDPKIVWEYTLANPAARGAVEMGQGISMAHGRVEVNGQTKVAAFAHTNNGGTGASGSVVTAINMETGGQLWSTSMHASQLYANPPRGAGAAVPASGIPGGVVALDLKARGTTTDLVFGTLYGEIWQLNAATGVSRHGANPLFRFSTNQHPIGSSVSIYSKGGSMFAVAVAGGYQDLTAGVLWSTTPHKAVSVSLSTPASQAPLTESSTAPYVPFTVSMGTNEKSYSQPQVIGGELYITTDTSDVNTLTYGTSGINTGRVYKVNLGTSVATSVIVRGGASAVTSMGNAVYVASANRALQLANVTDTVGEDASRNSGAKVARQMWLRSM